MERIEKFVVGTMPSTEIVPVETQEKNICILNKSDTGYLYIGFRPDISQESHLLKIDPERVANFESVALGSPIYAIGSNDNMDVTVLLFD